jgi:phosphoglycolate phosphatase
MPGVGFDLDMTLVDSRPGIHAALVAFRDETGVPIDADAVVTRLGPPIGRELLAYVGEAALPDALAVFRRLMAEIGVQNCVALPGAAEALAAVRAAGLTSLVVSGKYEPLAVLTLAHAGLTADLVVGDVWAKEKSAPLVEHGAIAYVGDHLGDIQAARKAGITAIAVATGPISAADLAAAGADLVLEDLTGFPAVIGTLR